jgi:membrane-bound ClpP family serine protease
MRRSDRQDLGRGRRDHLGLRLARRSRPQTGAEAMIGMPAEVVSTCRPTGQVRANGELWEATCAEARSSAT